MKAINRKFISRFLLVLLLIVITSGCGQISGDSNYTLGAGKTISGTLFILSQNAILEEESSVQGSVIMVCCNLTVKGNVNGNVVLVSGNVNIERPGNVNGDIEVIAGNIAH